jgi:hypothetical protein
MSGIKEEELDGILNRVYSRNLVPFELRLAIWKLVDLGKCLGCDLLYPNTRMHGCAVYGYSFCPRCVRPHFCLSLTSTHSHPLFNMNELIPALLVATLPTINLNLLDCRTDASLKYYALSGFSKAQVDLIREGLEEVALSSQFDLRGMVIEYVEGVFE